MGKRKKAPKIVLKEAAQARQASPSGSPSAASSDLVAPLKKGIVKEAKDDDDKKEKRPRNSLDGPTTLTEEYRKEVQDKVSKDKDEKAKKEKEEQEKREKEEQEQKLREQ